MRHLILTTALAMALALAGCPDDDDGGGGNDVTVDTTQDVTSDVQPDVEEDTTPDAEEDTTPPDAEEDATPDAEEDAAPDAEEDATPDAEEDATPAATYTADVQPIFASKCTGCHTGSGFGGHNMGTTYSDALLDASIAKCSGLTKGECAIVRIQAGDMPQGAGCTGDPAQDAGNAACLTQAEQDTIQAWIDAGLPE